MFRIMIAILVLVSALLTPLATPQVANASVSTTESIPTPWGDAIPILLVSPLMGESHAIWQNESRIWHSKVASGGWTTSVAFAYGEAPDAEFSRDGMLNVVFECLFAGNWETYFVSLSPVEGSQWTLSKNMAYTDGESRNTRLSIAPDGIVHATWQDTSPGYWVVYHAWQCGDRRQFFCNRPIPSGRGMNPDIFVDDYGNIFVSFVGNLRDGREQAVLLTVQNESGWWEPPMLVSEDLSEPATGLSISTSPNRGYLARLGWRNPSGKWMADANLSYAGLPQVTYPIKIRSIFLPFVGR